MILSVNVRCFMIDCTGIIDGHFPLDEIRAKLEMGIDPHEITGTEFEWECPLWTLGL